MKDITIIIKTFLREKSLFRLLDSIEKYNNDIKIIIVDDGRSDLSLKLKKKYELDIEYYKLDYDLGLSYGRNYALKMVKTKYFLLCDDDFVFTEETKIYKLKKLLEENSVDIVGGVIRNRFNYTEGDINSRIKNLIKSLYRQSPIHNYYGEIVKTEKELVVKYYNQNNFEKFIKTDICLNFFLAKTEKIKNAGGWNERLKIGEHTDFFIRMKDNNLKVLTTYECICDHYPVRTKEYSKYRDRIEEMTRILFETRGLNKQTSIFPEKKLQNIYYFKNGKLITKVENYAK